MPKAKKIPEFPDLIQEQGAFGRIQYVFFFFICAGINSVGWEQYDYYLTKNPTWDCQFTNTMEGKSYHYVFDSVEPINNPDHAKNADHAKICSPLYFCNTTKQEEGHIKDMVLKFAEQYLINNNGSVNEYDYDRGTPLFAYDNLYRRFNLTCAGTGTIALP